jgi:hypothetical protein
MKWVAQQGAPGRWLQIIYWIWGVSGLVISFLTPVGIPSILIWIGGIVLLGFGDVINQNQSKREAIWLKAWREQRRQTAQP